jgi:hypothetical protein
MTVYVQPAYIETDKDDAKAIVDEGERRVRDFLSGLYGCEPEDVNQNCQEFTVGVAAFALGYDSALTNVRRSLGIGGAK